MIEVRLGIMYEYGYGLTFIEGGWLWLCIGRVDTVTASLAHGMVYF